jgi:putative membrane protein
MVTQLANHVTYAYQQGQWDGPWHDGGPGWWLAFPIVFWLVVLLAAGYLIYRGSSRQSARRAAERTLAERYARGEISDEELRQRRAGLAR